MVFKFYIGEVFTVNSIAFSNINVVAFRHVGLDDNLAPKAPANLFSVFPVRLSALRNIPSLSFISFIYALS